MSKILIVYKSVHHKNTEKLLKGIKKYMNIDIIDVSNANSVNLSKYDYIGFASGIYFSEMHKSIYEFISEQENLPKNVFLIYTSGSGKKTYGKNIIKLLMLNKYNICGVFSCKGYDTYGILKFIGGISRNHPNECDIANASQYMKKFI